MRNKGAKRWCPFQTQTGGSIAAKSMRLSQRVLSSNRSSSKVERLARFVLAICRERALAASRASEGFEDKMAATAHEVLRMFSAMRSKWLDAFPATCLWNTMASSKWSGMEAGSPRTLKRTSSTQV